MRWDHVLEAVATRLADDSTLTSIFGTAIRKTGVQKWRVPSVEYTLIATEGKLELWEPHIVQFDVFTQTMADLATAERIIRRYFDLREPHFIEGVWMWATFLDGADLPGPSREGYFARANRYRFTPLREDQILGRTT